MLKPGDEIDIWVVDRALGQGGMGSVYRCHNREARRILAAVKVLDASLGRQALAKARFIREAEILFSLDHPGIVKVRNVRMDLAMPYLEMEFIDGVNLEARIQQGPMALAEALPLFQQVADALAYLHGKGIRHRDIKPSNIVIQPSGSAKLVDFGIATEADGTTITQQGQTFGSVSYAPPEWLEPNELDPVLWDIYAAGVVFYEVLTGVQAFPLSGVGTVQQQVVRMIAAKQRHPPLDPGPGVPAALRALIRDMTHPQWQERLGSAELLWQRLTAVDLAELEPGDIAAPPRRPTAWTPDPATRSLAGATMVPDFDSTEERPRDDLPPPPPRPVRPPDPVVAPPPAPDTLSAPTGSEPPPAPRTRGMLLGFGAVFVAFLAGLAYEFGTPEEAPPPDPAPVAAAPAPAPARPVRLAVIGLPAGTTPQARLGDAAPITGDATGVALGDVTPGAHTVTVTVGTCTDADVGCASGTCPPGCSSWRGEVVVPAGDGPYVAAITLPAPAPAPAATAAASTEPARAPRKGTGVVTVRSFARWLATHPQWAPDAAREAGKADAAYLSGWTGTTPPPGTEAKAVVSVPWDAAMAYCVARGGLPGVDDPPLTWSESATQPWHEYRSAEGRPAWRRSDGATSVAVKRGESGAYVGFRCAK